jgi:hypothetical protein
MRNISIYCRAVFTATHIHAGEWKSIRSPVFLSWFAKKFTRKELTMFKLKMVFCLILWVVVASAQPPDSLWSRTYGGANQDWLVSGAQTADGGYILAGYTYSFGAGGGDVWLVKTDGNGNTMWSRTFGGPLLDVARNVVQTIDGGYAIIAYTESFGAGSADCWLVKVNVNGVLLWSRTFGGHYADDGCGIEETADGGLILLGSTSSFGHGGGVSDLWLIKTDCNGNMVWNRTYGGSSNDYGAFVRQTSDGGFILTGQTFSFGGGHNDGWLLKTNANGDSLWSKTSNWPYEDSYSDIRQTADGGYAIAGFRYPNLPFGAYNDARLVRTDANGNTLWTLIYGYPGNTDDNFNWVCPTPDGGFAVAGCVKNTRSGGQSDAVLLRTDASGGILWVHEFSAGVWAEWFGGGVLASDGGYALWGATTSYGAGGEDGWMVRTEPEFRCSGYVTLERRGPTDWNYRLHWVSGALSRLVFKDVCPGTHGLCCDGASAAGWRATDYPDSVVFTTPNPLMSGSLVNFWLYHPTCTGPIGWTVGDSSGNVDGPLPVELLSFTALAGDQNVTLNWRTASETQNARFEIERNESMLAQVAGAGTSTTERRYDYPDRNLENGTTYTYKLFSVDARGIRKELATAAAMPTAQAAAVTEYALRQNYPNPFNAATTIVFDVAAKGSVQIKVYNLAGQEVATLVNRELNTGRHTIRFDGGGLPSGVYLCRMTAGDFQASQKILLVK